MFFPANLFASTEQTEPNTTKANIYPEHKNTTIQNKHKLECGPMPNVMATPANIGHRNDLFCVDWDVKPQLN